MTVIYMDQLAITRRSRQDVQEQAVLLAELAGEISGAAADVGQNRPALQGLLDQAKVIAAQMQRDLMILEAFETGRAQRVDGGTGEAWLIDEDLQEERLREVLEILERADADEAG